LLIRTDNDDGFHAANFGLKRACDGTELEDALTPLDLPELQRRFQRDLTVLAPLSGFFAEATVSDLLTTALGEALPFKPVDTSDLEDLPLQRLHRAELPFTLAASHTDSGEDVPFSDISVGFPNGVRFINTVVADHVVNKIYDITEIQAPLLYLTCSMMQEGDELEAHSHSQEVVVTMLLQMPDRGGEHFIGRPEGPSYREYGREDLSNGGVIINTGRLTHGVARVGATEEPRIGVHLGFGFPLF